MARAVAFAVVFGLVMSGCVGDDAGVDSLPGATVADGYDLRPVIDGFDRPTQLVIAPSGDLLLAELAGAENDGTGRVVRVDLDAPEERVELQSGLIKPTGLAVVGETLWIMEQQSLSFTTLEPGAPLTVVQDELPFNGRSEGSLTPTPDGGLMFNTSGRKRNDVVTEGSGIIFRIEDADPVGTGRPVPEPAIVARGLKHGYAHAFDAAGRLWATEMTDGTFDGEPAADELIEVQQDDDFGWPACVGNNRAVAEFGGTRQRCDQAPPSHALFEPQATPTAVESAPWDDDTLLVALWVDDEIVEVPSSTPPDGEPWQPTTVASGIGNPQDLVPDGDRLLVVDHSGGRVLALVKLG